MGVTQLGFAHVKNSDDAAGLTKAHKTCVASVAKAAAGWFAAGSVPALAPTSAGRVLAWRSAARHDTHALAQP
jgi:hypothetical protein